MVKKDIDEKIRLAISVFDWQTFEKLINTHLNKKERLSYLKLAIIEWELNVDYFWDYNIGSKMVSGYMFKDEEKHKDINGNYVFLSNSFFRKCIEQLKNEYNNPETIDISVLVLRGLYYGRKK